MESLKKNITVAAVLSAETPDTTNEILSVSGADISALKLGTSPLNTEHINPEDIEKTGDKDFKGFNTVIGRIVTAKKIFSEKDCENQYELDAWSDLQVPLIFGYIQFFDGDDAHDNAKAASSLIRMAHKNEFEHMIGFSVEGQILKREGNRLAETVIKKVAATAKPANKAATIKGIVQDSKSSSSDAMFKAEQDDTSILHKSIISKHTHVVQDDFGLSNALFKLRKTLDAGSTAAAPSSLSGGSALQTEGHLAKLERRVGKKPISRDLLKKLLGDATNEQLEKVYSHLKLLRFKKHTEECEDAYRQLKK